METLAADFEDLPKDHKNYTAVTELVEMGVVAGYEDGTFRPDNEITRTEFCALLARTLGFDKETYQVEKVPFDDVKDDYWGIAFISFCYEKGLINGMGDGTFAPAAKVTYEQVIKMAVCAVGAQDEELLKDGEKWYAPFLRTAEKYELIENVNAKAGKNAMRSDCAQVVYNAIGTGLIEKLQPDTEKEPEAEEETEKDSEDSDGEDEDKTDEPADDEELTEEEKAEIEQNEIWDKVFAKKDFSVVKTIVVDAGHNYEGMDTGARNEKLDVHEEDVTWQIADKLAAYLEEKGYNVVRTRETQKSSIGNTSVTDSLKARVNMAHEKEADLFISIHCNVGGGKGTETYCFSKGGYAYSLAKLIQGNITDKTGLYDRGVKSSGFYVIKNTRMPAVLVETAFMDNAADVEVLTTEDGQKKIAMAIADAVHEYATVEAKKVKEELRKKAEEERIEKESKAAENADEDSSEE